jgi:hypothetical protein
VVAGAASAIHLGVTPGPFAPSSATVVVLGLVVFTVIVTVGLLLVRGRWARRLGVALVVAELALVAATGFDVWGAVAVTAAVVGLVGLLGRWLDGWVRPRPSATGPDAKAVLLLLGLLAYVPAVGIAAPAGLETAHGVLGCAAVLLAWAYSKALVWSLWALRLVLAPIAAAAVLASPLPGAVLLTTLTVGVVWLAWTREALLSVQPLDDRLPSPRRPRGGDGGESRAGSGDTTSQGEPEATA